MNPFDEIAVEEAVRMKERAWRPRSSPCRSASPQCQETLRTALAIGADRAILVETDVETQPLAVAKVLKAPSWRKEQPKLVILGKQAIDDDANQTGQMLAALLGWPQATFASKVGRRRRRATVTREIDGGLETIAIKLPGDRDDRSAPERAALRDAAQHHEGEEEAARTHHAGSARRRRHAAADDLKVVEPAKRSGGGRVADVKELVAEAASDEAEGSIVMVT